MIGTDAGFDRKARSLTRGGTAHADGPSDDGASRNQRAKEKVK